MLHYIITNRQILPDANGEYIKIDRGETPSDDLRFGTFDSGVYKTTNDPGRLSCFFPIPKHLIGRL
jgi:hypothetical protein